MELLCRAPQEELDLANESLFLSTRNTHTCETLGLEGIVILKALASEMRVRILDLLADHDCSIGELAQNLGISQPTVTKHVNVLAEAGLVRREYASGVQGTQTRCHLVFDRFVFNLAPAPPPKLYVEDLEMPIGLYTLARPVVTCGMASRAGMIGAQDQPQVFFLPQRAEAQVLWSAGGFVEYTFANTLPVAAEIQRLELSMEICSETKDFNLDYPSDITVWVNGVDIGSWTSPGDMGGKRGRLNPEWWAPHGTQYGFLKTWGVDADGGYVDDVLISRRTIADLRLQPEQAIRVRIGIKPEALHAGGFNLFGRGFGNHEQDLLLRLHYSGARPRVHWTAAERGKEGTDPDAKNADAAGDLTSPLTQS